MYHVLVHGKDWTDGFTGLHDRERLVDVGQFVAMRNELVYFQVSVHVLHK